MGSETNIEMHCYMNQQGAAIHFFRTGARVCLCGMSPKLSRWLQLVEYLKVLFR